VSNIRIRFHIVLFIFVELVGAQSLNGIIQEIEVEGNDYFSDFEIIYFSDLKIGDEINDYMIQERISRMWDRGYFSYIDIESFQLDNSENIKLLISIKERYQINKITFTGNKKKKSDSLLKELNIEEGQLFSDHDCYLAINTIRDLYSEKDYNDVSISYDIVELEKVESGKGLTRVDIIFNISEGIKTKIYDINYSGNDSFSKGKLNRAMKEVKPWRWYFPWNGKYNDQKIKLSIENLNKFYKNSGYYDFEVKDYLVKKNEKKTSLNIDLKEGKRYTFRNFIWNGNYLFKDRLLQEVLGFKPGDIYNKEKFDLAVYESVVPLYMDQGYFYFNLEPQITPIGDDSLDVVFNIEENDIVYINEIKIIGNKKTRENVIRRELDIFPGNIFNRKLLINSIRDLFMLNYFENVIPDVRPVDENHVDVIIEVIEKSIGQANFTMGYNGVYGFTGGGGFEFPNLFGGGQNVTISYQRGINGTSSTAYQSTIANPDSNESVNQSFNFNFVEPRIFDTPNLIGLQLFYNESGQGQSMTSPFDVTTKGVSVRFGRRFKFPDRYFKGSWSIRVSESSYFSDSESNFYPYYGSNIDTEEIDDQYVYKSGGISMTQTIDRDDRDHPEYPTTGSKMNFTSTYSKSLVNEGQDYLKNIFSISSYVPVYKKLVFNQNFKAGIINTLTDFQIPYYSRFFMGGTGIPYGEMLRGYEFNSVGPYESRSLGGNIILKFSMELRLALSDSPTIFLFLFADAGNVWQDFDSFDVYNLKRSIGIGGRIFVPMLGMLGYDIGYGFDRANDAQDSIHGLEYHFVFGMPLN